jgi:hypothetical protein
VPTTTPAKRKPAPRKAAKKTRSNTYNSYSLPEKAKALSVLDFFKGNTRAAAKHLGMSASTLANIATQAQRNAEFSAKVRQLREENNNHLGPAAIDTSWEALYRMKELLPTAALRDATVAFGMTVERGLILQGQPTVIHGRAPSLDGLSLAEKKALAEAWRAMLAKPVAAVELPQLPSTEVVAENEA